MTKKLFFIIDNSPHIILELYGLGIQSIYKSPERISKD